MSFEIPANFNYVSIARRRIVSSLASTENLKDDKFPTRIVNSKCTPI